MITRKLRSILGLALAVLTMIAGPGLPLSGQAFALAPTDSAPANGPAVPQVDGTHGSLGAPGPETSATAATDPTPILADDFSTCSLGTFEDSTGLATCEKGEYTITVKQANYSWWVAYSDQIDDAIIAVDARSVSSDPFSPYGLIWRSTSSENSFYVFVIGSGGRYGVFLYDRPNFTTLVPYTFSPAINPDTGTNHLKVVAQGDQAALYVNGQWLDTITDSTYAKGKVGFYAESNNAGGKAAFDNLLVSAIDQPLVLPTPAPADAGTSILWDNFDDPNACILGSYGDSTAVATCLNGEYNITIKVANHSEWVTYPDLIDNAVIQADGRSVNSTPFGSYGLIWRVSDDGNHFYLFVIGSDGRYGVFRYDGPDFTALVPYTASDAINPDVSSNHLKVVVQGDQMAVYANDQWLNTVSDSALTTGQVGVYAETSDPNAQVAFDNLNVTETNATPLLSDNFNDPSACILGSFDDSTGLLTCENGDYTITIKQANYAQWVTYADLFTNTIVEVDARSVDATPFASYGLIWRSSSDLNSFYLFLIRGGGQYGVFRYDQGNFDVLVPNTPSTAINIGADTNRLKVIVQGDQMAVYVNDQWLSTVTDSTLAEGTIGVYAEATDTNAKAAFDNLSVSAIEQPISLPVAVPSGAPDASLAFQDDFSTCVLPTVDDSDHALGCQDGQYTMLSKVPETRWVYYGDDFTDAVLQVDTRIISTTSTAFVEYGLVFRVAGDGNSYYAFTVTNDGEYSFFYLQNDNWTEVVSYTPSPAVLTDGSWNHLDVYFQGDQFTFFVNGQLLTTVSDATFGDGTVGFVLNTDEGRSQVAFSNLRVWQLNSPYTPPRGVPVP